MKFGLFSVVDHYPKELRRSSQQLYDELLEQVEYADELGFDSFWVAEHHFHEYGGIPRPAIWMAAAAQRTSRIKLGTAVTVLPFDNPIRTAEDFAMVDNLSNGRLILGVGSGYLDHEYHGFGVNKKEKRQLFDEALEVIRKAWTGEKFSFQGRHFQFSDIQLNVLPLQKPHPPIHVAILSNEAAKFVGMMGFPIMMIPYATTEAFSELRETVSEFKSNYNGKIAGSVPFGLHAYCAADFKTAEGEVREAMDRYVRTRLYARQRSFESLVDKDLIAFGSPEDIIRVARRYEEAGLTDFLAISNFGGLEHKKVMRSMKLMAEEVLPAFGGTIVNFSPT